MAAARIMPSNRRRRNNFPEKDRFGWTRSDGGGMENEVIYDHQAGEHVIGTATTWNEVHEVCAQCGLRIEPIGSEGPKSSLHPRSSEAVPGR
jgi:hypothetical protein